ncbi:hypothetical protein YC2023_035716 [Brassica napus]
MEFFISQRASSTQYKTPICIKSTEAIAILEGKCGCVRALATGDDNESVSPHLDGPGPWATWRKEVGRRRDCVWYWREKILHFDESKEKKTSQLSRAIVGSHLRDSTPSDTQGK